MDAQTLSTAFAALAGVLILILLLSRGLRRFGLAPAMPSQGGRQGMRRLAVLEALPIDGRRRLLLIRCDETAMLLVTGGPQDVLLPLPAAPETRA